MTTSERWWWIGWAACMVTTGLLTAYLRGCADPLIPPGAWHGLLSGMFVVIVWPSLAWLLRTFARWGFPDLLR